MDVEGIRELVRRPSRRTARWAVAASMLLAVPIAWSIRQSRLTHEALERAVAAEKSAAEARDQVQGRPPRDPAVRRSRHDDPAEIARVQQLYREIENLGRIQEDVDQSLRTDRLYVPKKK